MSLKPIIFLIFVLSVEYKAQHVFSTGVAKQMYYGYQAHPSDFKPTNSFEGNYFAGFGYLGLKAGFSLSPKTEFGLKYNLYWAIGLTSKLNKVISIHLLPGLLKYSATQAMYDGKTPYWRYSYTSKTTNSFMLNVGSFFSLGKKNKRFMIGTDVYFWSETITLLSFYRRYPVSGDMYVRRITFALSANYMFGEPNGHKHKVDSVKSHHIVGLGIGRNSNPMYYPKPVNFSLNYFYSWQYFATRFMGDIQLATDFGIKSNLFFAAGLTTSLQNPISFHALLGMNSINMSKPYFYDASGQKVSLKPETHPAFLGGIFLRPDRYKKLCLGLEYFRWDEFLKSKNLNSDNITSYYNHTWIISLNYFINTK
jgi:hypothetical protein